MKIAIVGAGAMGSLFGALLAEAGSEVWLIDVWQDHVAAIQDKGLTIEREGRTRKVDIQATIDPSRVKSVDLVIIFVKSTHTAAAVETAAKLLDSGGLVMTLQNGMGNAEIIAQAVDSSRILGGTTSHGATLLSPGCIRHAGSGATVIGSWSRDETGQNHARRMAAYFSTAGIATEAVADVLQVIWNKLLVNVGINAITALTGIKNGQLLDLDTTRDVSRRAVEEAAAVASAQGVNTRSDAVEHVFSIAEATAPNRSSMGQDVDNRRQTEINAINGYIVRAARNLGIQTPVNQTLAALVETLQYHYQERSEP